MDLLFHAAKRGKTVIRFSLPPPVSDVSVIMDPTRKGVGLGGRLGALTPLSRFEIFADPCLSVVLVPSVWVVVLLRR